MTDLDINTISLDFYRASKEAFLQQVKDSDKTKPYYFIEKSVFIEAFTDEFQKTCRSLAKQYSLEPSEIQDFLLPRLNEQSGTPIISTSSSLDTSTIKDSIQSYVSKYSTEIIQEQFNGTFEKNETTISEEKNSLSAEEQQKKEHFHQLFEEYSKLETFEEKRDFIAENYNINIAELEQEEQENFISQFEKTMTFSQKLEDLITDDMNLEQIEEQKNKLAKELEIPEENIPKIEEFYDSITEGNQEHAIELAKEMGMTEKEIEKISEKIKEQETESDTFFKKTQENTYHDSIPNTIKDDFDDLFENEDEITALFDAEPTEEFTYEEEANINHNLEFANDDFDDLFENEDEISALFDTEPTEEISYDKSEETVTNTTNFDQQISDAQKETLSGHPSMMLGSEPQDYIEDIQVSKLQELFKNITDKLKTVPIIKNLFIPKNTLLEAGQPQMTQTQETSNLPVKQTLFTRARAFLLNLTAKNEPTENQPTHYIEPEKQDFSYTGPLNPIKPQNSKPETITIDLQNNAVQPDTEQENAFEIE